MTAPPLRRAAPLLAALAVAAAAPALTAEPALARGGDDRVEVRRTVACARDGTMRLRLRAEDGRIRVDTQVRTGRPGVWRLTVLHERRTVLRARVRVTRGSRGFERRVVVPDWAGADAVSARAVSPRGGTCAATLTVAGS